MKKWTVIWTFVANYGKLEVAANTAEDAAKQVDSFYSEEFGQKAIVYVFEGEPAFVRQRRDGKKY